MKTFSIYSASIDGISCSVSNAPAGETVESIHNSKGWGSLDELRKRITLWMNGAKAGQVFQTSGSVIVCHKSR